MAATYAQRDYPPIPEIRRIGVIGAGQMGGGIAQVAAEAGYEVRLSDVSRQALDAAVSRIDYFLGRHVQKAVLSEADKAQALGRIKTGEGMDLFRDCDLVIEAATENEELKRKIFASLVPSLKPGAIIASNTSSISITRLAAITDRPERFIGMHFMNPVPAMKLIEIIRGIATEEDTYQAIRGVAERLGKIPVTAEDFPAFIVNRILLPMINEAVYTLYEGVGTVESIDNAMKLGANHPMGPLGARRLHRPGYLPVDHAGALRGTCRQQVPPLPAPGEVCRGRLARPQGQARLLRLSRRDARPHPIAHSCGSSSPL